MQYIFLPTNPYIIPWSTFTCVLYVVSFYNDCLTLATGLYTLLVPWRKTMQTVASFVMFMDSMIFFITAYRKESNQSLEKKKANQEAAKQLERVKMQKKEISGFLDLKKNISQKEIEARKNS